MESERQNDISTKTDICLPCMDIIVHPDDDIEVIVRKGKNSEKCCMKNNKTLDVLVGYFVDHWMKEKLAKVFTVVHRSPEIAHQNDENESTIVNVEFTPEDRHFTRYKCKDASGAQNRKPTIKLIGRNEKQTDGNDTVLWDSWSKYAIIPDHEDIVYDEQHGYIEIKKAGIYQIYTQVVLNHDTITQKWKDAPYIHQHFVVCTRQEQEQIILQASSSYCSFKTDNQTITSYLGGAFHLSEGDKLAVKVHERAEIVPIAHMNFFGAFML